jgi:nucleoside-diphosphate-sugar epimerase
MREVTGVMNVSSGTTAAVRDVVGVLVKAAGFRGRVAWQADMPVGIAERSVCDRILRGLGFSCDYDLEAGLTATWGWYESHADSVRGAPPARRASA